jgi:hypothetical protein
MTVVKISLWTTTKVSHMYFIRWFVFVVIEKTFIFYWLIPYFIILFTRKLLTYSNSFYTEYQVIYLLADGDTSLKEWKDWDVLGLYWELIRFLNLLMSFPSLSVKAAVELEKDLLILFSTLLEWFLGFRRLTFSSYS